MAELYSVRGLRRCFGDREVLNIPGLALEEGVIYGLLGPNGSGKTTLMRLLAFMDRPDDGEIFFRGARVRPEERAGFRARVVWVPQVPVMSTGTLLYNVQYPMRLKGVRGQQGRERAMALLETVGLAHLAMAPARRLSGGEAQRGSIARALAAGAEVILFDEPTASVDFRSRGEIIRLIHDLWKIRGLSVIVTTHDFELAAEVCQEEITLMDGKVVSRYPVAALVESSGGIPRAVTARQGNLAKEGNQLFLALEKDTTVQVSKKAASAAPPSANVPAVVVGMAESATGIVLRLRLAPGNDFVAMLSDKEDMELARTLTLDQTIRVR